MPSGYAPCEGVRTPRTIAIAREELAGADGPRLLAELGFAFPLLLRSPGYHTGRNFMLVESAAGLRRRPPSFPATNFWRSNISMPEAATAMRENTA